MNVIMRYQKNSNKRKVHIFQKAIEKEEKH